MIIENTKVDISDYDIGILDSKAKIGYVKQGKKRKPRIEIYVITNNEKLTEYLKIKCGGYIFIVNNDYGWRITGKKAIALLTDIKDYLIFNKEAAIIVLSENEQTAINI